MSTSDAPEPPAGTTADAWEPWENDDGTTTRYRFIHAERSIDKRPDIRVTSMAAQLPDGSIDDGSKVEEPPCLYVDFSTDTGLSAQEARQLAAVLVVGADEIDRWVDAPGVTASPGAGDRLTGSR